MMKSIPFNVTKAALLILPLTFLAACSDGSSDPVMNDPAMDDPNMNNPETNGNPDSDDLPVVRVETWEEILRNVVALTNAERALERHNSVLDRVASLSGLVMDQTIFEDTSGTLVSMGLTMQPLADPDNRFVVDYLCNSEGSLNVTLSPGVNNYAMVADDCAIDSDVYDGGFSHFGAGREGINSTLDNMDVKLADSTAYLLSGAYSTFFDRPGVRESYQWTDAVMMDQSQNGVYSVDSFNMLNESASGSLGEFLHSAAVKGGFSVTADWTDNKPVHVAVDLSLGGSYQVDQVDQNTLPTQWTTGSLSVTAADGSQLTLTPIESDPTSATVQVSGINDPQQVLWSNEYQVSCFADEDVFPTCQ